MYTLYISVQKRIGALLLVFSSLLALCGCNGSIYANYRELDTLQLVQTIGIDPGDEKKLRVTISTGAGTEAIPTAKISRESESIILAMEYLQDYSGKEELYFSHTRYALLGDEAARRYLPEFLDYIERSPRLRMDITPYVVRGGTAEKAISESGDKRYEVTEAITAMERASKRNGVCYPYSCREVARSIAEYGGALICAVAAKKTEDSVFVESGKLAVVPSGYGIIKDGKLAGYLDINESRGANLLLNQIENSSFYFEPAGLSGVTVLTDVSNTEYTAVFDESNVLRQLKVEISLKAGLVENDSLLDLSDPDVEKAMNRALSEKLCEYSEKAMRHSLELECDFMGLYGTLLCKYPSKLAESKESFMPMLKNAEISISADAKIDHSFNMVRPIGEGGKEGGDEQQG